MKHIHKPKQVLVADKLSEYRLVDRKKIKVCIAITFITMLVEIIGGIMTNSLALISDAGHMFTHFFALAVSMSAMAVAERPACHHRTFGFYRIEILAALFNSLFLFAATIWIFIEGIRRIMYPKEIAGWEMFVVALIGLVVNVASVLILHGSRRHNLNIKSAFLHMAADTLSSVAVVVGAVVLSFTGWNIIDPILSIVIAGMIAFWGWGLFKDSVNILLEAAPKGIHSDDIRISLMCAIPQIEEITDLHVWEITSKMYSLTAHIKLKDEPDRGVAREILHKIRHTVNERFDIEHVTIEFD
ncbi:MAG: cation diffusion facilitator family transporter [Candidatus Omnitrophota bacterium]